MSKEEQEPVEGVMFWNGCLFEQLNPLKTFLGTPSGQFGPELGFARKLLEIDPSQMVYLIKYSSSGKALDSGWADQKWTGDRPEANRWNFYPGLDPNDINQGICYKQMLDKVNAALDYLSGQGISYQIKGFVWMQGEQDSKNIVSATRYAQNLKRLIDRLHKDLKLKEAIPFVYGQVLPYEPPADRFICQDEVRQSQANADADSGHADSIPNAYMVSTESCPVSSVDLVHYTTKGQMILGRDVAFEMSKALGGVRDPQRRAGGLFRRVPGGTSVRPRDAVRGLQGRRPQERGWRPDVAVAARGFSAVERACVLRDGQ